MKRNGLPNFQKISRQYGRENRSIPPILGSTSNAWMDFPEECWEHEEFEESLVRGREHFVVTMKVPCLNFT